MDNMFEHAYFCKPYKTRSGDKVFYFEKHIGEYPHMLLFSPTEASYYDDSGKNEDSTEFDVVSEWQEEINEAELDRLANAHCKELEELGCKFNVQERLIIIDTYKAGCRKAMKK